MPMHTARLQQASTLRGQLVELGYHDPLGADSVGLVTSLLKDVLTVQQQLAKRNEQIDSMAHAIKSADGHANFGAMRLQVGALTRTNEKLTAENRRLVEAGPAERRDLTNEVAVLRNRAEDGAFLSAELHRTNRRLEEENAGLRDAANTSFEVNGVVLPSGQEVRWHGRKQHMQAHSPVAPAAPPRREQAGASGEARQMVEAEVPARLVRAAEAQITTLLARCGAAEARGAALEGRLTKAKAMLAERDSATQRLTQELAESREGEGSAGRLAHHEAASSAIAQLNHQVDFLNTTCARLQKELQHERGGWDSAADRDRERRSLLGVVDNLQREKRQVAREVGAGLFALEKMQPEAAAAAGFTVPQYDGPGDIDAEERSSLSDLY